jgi:hypothetical protein
MDDKRSTVRHELEAAGWERVERGGFIVWRNPKSGHLYPQDVALHIVRENREAENALSEEGAA